MNRLVVTLALLAILSPSLAVPDVETSAVKVRPASEPFRSGTTADRWTPRPLPKAMAAPLGRVHPLPWVSDPVAPDRAGARARACKVFDRNANGFADAGEALVEGWKFRLTDGMRRARVRATGWDGCADFTGLAPGRYWLSEILPPAWDPVEGTRVGVDVGALGGAAAPATFFAGDCVQYARMGDLDYWAAPAGLRLLEDWDRHYLTSLAPFHFEGEQQPASAAGAPPSAWGPETWQAAFSRYLTDRKVSGDPRGRLAQEVLVFALNARHFLEGAQVVLLDERPIFVDDLLFEGILAWYGDNPSWNHEMTAVLASLNGARELAYVPRDTCQVAYLPF